MNIIIPMAGIGKRMRPHTLTVPKPLIPIAGKPIVQRLVEDIAKVTGAQIEQIGFVVGDFGKEVENSLKAIAASVGAQGKIYYQYEALGTGHAIYCAKELLQGNVIVAFADTLFKANFTLDREQDAIIWVQKVDDPSAFGVVKLDKNNQITDFVEKPKTPVSDLAIIGIYYFKNGEILRDELKRLIDNDLKDSGEYQLTRALETMKVNGVKFYPGQVIDWLDCGNKNATVDTNKRYLQYLEEQPLKGENVTIENAVVIEPSYVGENVVLRNSVVGPYVSIGKNSVIEDSIINNSIVQAGSNVKNMVLENSMIGNFVNLQGKKFDLSIGDYNSIIQ
ncbi:MAG: sugar phosphate nucleotidyltransferase [Cyclobacteriaceae bacterium]